MYKGPETRQFSEHYRMDLFLFDESFGTKKFKDRMTVTICVNYVHESELPVVHSAKQHSFKNLYSNALPCCVVS